MKKMRWWGNGRQERRVFEIHFWKFRLSLYKEVKAEQVRSDSTTVGTNNPALATPDPKLNKEDMK